jgi:hypothetical protein
MSDKSPTSDAAFLEKQRRYQLLTAAMRGHVRHQQKGAISTAVIDGLFQHPDRGRRRCCEGSRLIAALPTRSLTTSASGTGAKTARPRDPRDRLSRSL